MSRNWRSRRGEIDLVVVHSDVLVFVEVKALLSDNRDSDPLVHLTPHKVARLRRLAQRWRARGRHRRYRHLPWRVDGIAILFLTNATHPLVWWRQDVDHRGPK